MRFSLTQEPWIPSRTSAGVVADLSLFDVLARAHDIDEVVDPSPLVTLTLHRLLLAILHRVFGPTTLERWRDLFSRGSFDVDAIRSYLDTHEERFDLLHPVRPFYQVRGLRQLYQSESIRRLVFERSPYGNSVNVFQHRPMNRTDTLTLAEAARAVLALHGFAPGGLIKKKDEPSAASAGPLNRGAFVLMRGENLFETLLLNLVIYDPAENKPIPAVDADLPAWEQDVMARPLGVKEPSRKPHGWIDLLTWQSRRLELVISDDGRQAIGVVHCVGQRLDDEGLHEPMLAYSPDKSGELRPINVVEERAIWRDLHSFVGGRAARPPVAVAQLAALGEPFLRNRPRIVLDVLGMRGDQAAIKLTRRERVAISSALLLGPKRIHTLERAVDLAEEVFRQLRAAIQDYAENSGPLRVTHAEAGGYLTSRGDGLRSYWVTLGGLFGRFLEDVSRGDPEAALLKFKVCARLEAERAMRAALDSAGSSANRLKGAAIAERRLSRYLDSVVPMLGAAS